LAHKTNISSEIFVSNINIY